jgi:long-chain fatty acid transport protein
VNRLAACTLALALSAVTSEARAGGFGVPEYGVRRTGMAAVIGRPDEPSAVFHNPAGLTLQHGTRIYGSFGLAVVQTGFRLRPWDRSEEFIDAPVDADGYYPRTEPSRAFGVIPMLVGTHEVIPDKLWIAGSLYVANATGARFREEDVTRYHLINGYVVAPLAQASVAYKLDPRWSFGAGLGVMNVRIHGYRYFYPIYDGSDLRNLFGTAAQLTIDGSDWQPAWNVGVLATPVPRLTIGAAVIGRVDPRPAGPIRAVFDDDSVSDPGFVLEGTQETELLLPWTFHAGANLDVTPNLELGTELRYYLYRQFDQQVTDIEGIFLIDQLVSEKSYRDSYQLAGGARLHGLAAAPGLELMAGLHYDRTPAPGRTVSLEQPTFTHWGLHSGLRWELGRWRLAASYTRYWYEVPLIEDSVTSPPSNIQGEGVNNIFTLSFEAALDARKEAP